MNMPKLLRLYLISIAVGGSLAVIFTALLLAFDIAHLRHLVTSTNGGFIAVIMLIAFHTILFSGVQFGYAVMRLARSDNDGRGKRFRARQMGMRARAMVPALTAVRPSGAKKPDERS